MQGRVKWFNSQKGYGFIAPDDGTKDVFVHMNSVTKAGMMDLAEGQTLLFDIEKGKNGKNAATNLKAV